MGGRLWLRYSFKQATQVKNDVPLYEDFARFTTKGAPFGNAASLHAARECRRGGSEIKSPKMVKDAGDSENWRDKTPQSSSKMLGIVGETFREQVLREVLADHPKLTREKALRMIVAAGG